MRRERVVFAETIPGGLPYWKREALLQRLMGDMGPGASVTIEDYPGIGLTRVEVRVPAFWTWTYQWHLLRWDRAACGLLALNVVLAAFNFWIAAYARELFSLVNLAAGFWLSWLAVCQVRAFKRRKS